MVIDIDLASRTGVIRFLLHVLGEGPIEITPILASVFLHLVDSPRTRAYLQVGSDLEVSLSDADVKYLLKLFSAGIDRDNGCVWQGTRSCGTYEGLCKSCAVNAPNMEWYECYILGLDHRLTFFFSRTNVLLCG